MKQIFLFGLVAMSVLTISGCNSKQHTMENKVRIIFLHHSTGKSVWRGNASRYLYKLGFKGETEKWFNRYNRRNGTNYVIEEKYFPKSEPYGWKNYPYDYYNIWVKNAGTVEYMEEPTLEILTEQYDMIIWKHCFPVGRIMEDTLADIDSDVKTLANYKLQYQALKEKMHTFPDTKFLVWTGAALVEAKTTPEQAARTSEFFDWVKSEWDEKNDNIFLWDLYELETGGGMFLKPEYSKGPDNSHPNKEFSSLASKLFSQRIINVIEGRGDSTSLTGE